MAGAACTALYERGGGNSLACSRFGGKALRSAERTTQLSTPLLSFFFLWIVLQAPPPPLSASSLEASIVFLPRDQMRIQQFMPWPIEGVYSPSNILLKKSFTEIPESVRWNPNLVMILEVQESVFFFFLSTNSKSAFSSNISRGGGAATIIPPPPHISPSFRQGKREIPKTN